MFRATKRAFGLRLGGLALAAAAAATAATALGDIQGTQGTPVVPGVPAGREVEAALKSVREGRIDEAIAALRLGVKAHPEWPPAPLIAARLLAASGNLPQAKRVVEVAGSESPDDPRVAMAFADLSLLDGRFHDALLNAELGLDLLKAGKVKIDEAEAKKVRVEAAGVLASVGEARENWEAARARLADWLAEEPANAPLRVRFGRALFNLGKTDDALREFARAAKDDPKSDPVGVTMALLYSRKGDTAKADEWFAKALKDEPKNARVRLSQGGWLLDRGKAAEAKAAADAAVKLDPKNRDTRLLRAMVDLHLHDFAAAGASLDALHRDFPTDATVANLLAIALAEQNDPEGRSRALQLASANVRQNPRSVDFLATLGWIRYRMGDPAEAEKILRAATAAGQANPDTAYFFARVLAERGQAEDARKILAMAVAQPNSFAFKSDAQAMLDKLSAAAAPRP